MIKEQQTIRNPTPETQDQLLTVPQLAAYLKLSVSAVHKMTRSKKIPFYRPGGKILFRKSQIDLWLEEYENPRIPKSTQTHLSDKTLKTKHNANN